MLELSVSNFLFELRKVWLKFDHLKSLVCKGVASRGTTRVVTVLKVKKLIHQGAREFLAIVTIDYGGIVASFLNMGSESLRVSF